MCGWFTPPMPSWEGMSTKAATRAFRFRMKAISGGCKGRWRPTRCEPGCKTGGGLVVVEPIVATGLCWAGGSGAAQAGALASRRALAQGRERPAGSRPLGFAEAQRAPRQPQWPAALGGELRDQNGVGIDFAPARPPPQTVARRLKDSCPMPVPFFVPFSPVPQG